MSGQLEALQLIVRDETADTVKRHQAADHSIELRLAAVPEPQEGDADVIAEQQPWSRETETQRWLADVFGRSFPRAVKGLPLSLARQNVKERRQLRTLLTLVVDANASRLERLATCAVVLSLHMPADGFYRRNGYTADRLLAEVLPETATTFDSSHVVRQVKRPPESLRDVWR